MLRRSQISPSSQQPNSPANKNHPNVTDLIDASNGNVHYHKSRVAGSEYKIEIFDPMSESLLITAKAPSASSKTKTLELYNPTSVVELRSTGTIMFKWAFKWEEHEFEWRRDQCFLIRKPDPPVLVAVTKEPSRNFKTSQVQILDYNLNRFDIVDRKGLEIVMLTALMTFHDAKDLDAMSTPGAEAPSNLFSLSRMVSSTNPTASQPGGTVVGVEAPPPPPPKPAPKTGLDRIVEMQSLKGEDYNEITIEEEGSIQEYAEYCNTLLSDDAMLFISIKSSAPEFVTKVLQIVEETKRIRYKAGLDEETDLHQYVLYDTEKKKGRKRINLNDDAAKKEKYKPPSDLVVHLSKIDMPELRPTSQPIDKGKTKENKKVKHLAPSPGSTAPSPSTLPPFAASSSSERKLPKNRVTRTSQPPTHPPPAGILNYHSSQPSNPVSATFPSQTPRRVFSEFPYANSSYQWKWQPELWGDSWTGFLQLAQVTYIKSKYAWRLPASTSFCPP